VTTPGVPGVADGAPVLDQVEMESVIYLGGGKLLQQIVGFLTAGFLWDQAQTAGDTMNVGIDREGWLAQGEKQDDGGCLWSNPGDIEQPGASLLRVHCSEEIKLYPAPLLRDAV
jgi:hypothetical protein